jgi:hypothetical protein
MVLIKPLTRPYESISPKKSGISLSKCWVLFVVSICIYAAAKSKNHPDGLRGAAKDLVPATSDEGIASTKTSAEVAVAVPVASPQVPKTVETPKAEVKTVEAPKNEVKSAEPSPGKLCERKIGVNLSDQTKWPTPYTPSYFDKEPESDESVVVYNDGPFGNTLILALFHALDMAYDKKCGVMVTKDSAWIWDHMSTWFYGGKARDDAFYKSMEDAFGFKVVENLTEASNQKKVLHKLNAQAGLYARSKTLDATKLRNRRDTIYRKLFSLPNPQCNGIDAAGMNKPDAKYTVIDVPFQDGWNDRVKAYTQHDHTANFEMKPEYVKSILDPLGMTDQPIFLQKSNHPELDREEVKRLIADATLKTQDRDASNDLYMSVLADVFIGFPSSHWALMVARMRYALGMKNTFVLTEQKDNKWVSYVDDVNYLELYDTSSPWFG